ncbi:MAG TPA: hypothetical protein VEJ68_05745 [Candidatus Bathyarchaeia archaeon]|nr:hypothetical protein [Candidatus Bathyarchaeia archaeon]
MKHGTMKKTDKLYASLSALSAVLLLSGALVVPSMSAFAVEQNFTSDARKGPKGNDNNGNDNHDNNSCKCPNEKAISLLEQQRNILQNEKQIVTKFTNEQIQVLKKEIQIATKQHNTKLVAALQAQIVNLQNQENTKLQKIDSQITQINAKIAQLKAQCEDFKKYCKKYSKQD